MHSNEAITRGTIFNKYYILMFFVTFAYNLALTVGTTSFPLYVKYLGGNTDLTGLVSLLFSVMCIVGRVVSSYTTDNKGRSITMFYGCLFFAVSVLFMGILPGLFLISVFRVLTGFGFAVCNTSTAAANIDVSPPKQLRLATGLFYATASITLIISGLVAESFSVSGRYSILFTAIAVVLAVGAVLSWLCNYERLPAYKELRRVDDKLFEGDDKPKGIHKFFEKSALPAAIVAFTLNIGMSLIINFLFVFASQTGISNFGQFFTIGSVISLAFQVFGHKITARYSVMRIFFPCTILFSISLIVLGYSSSMWVYFITAIIYGVNYGLMWPMLYALALKAVPANRRGAASSTLFISNDFGVGVGALIWGVTIKGFGFPVTFTIAAIVYAFALVLLAVFFGKKRLRTEPLEVALK